jgi:hypothetical protein
MKNFTFCLLLISSCIIHSVQAQNMAINTDGSTPDASAMVDIASTTKGFLLPRMTTTQQNAIPLPATGLLIFNTTDNGFKVNTGTPAAPVWTPLLFSGNAITLINGLTGSSQTFTTGTSGNDFGISSSGSTHTFNIPTASAASRGALSAADWSIFNGKQTALGFTPYNATNPSGYISWSSLAGATDATISSPANGQILQYNIVTGKWVNTTPGFLSAYTETDPIVRAINGIVKSNGTTISAAVAGTDYVIPSGNVTGSAGSFTGNLAGEVTGTQSATVVGNAAVIGKVLTGYTSGSGTVAATDNILQAIQKINGNDVLKAPLASPMFTGVPAAPTAAAGTNTTQIATTAFVTSAVSAGTSTSFSGSLAGDVTGTQSATVVGKINGTSLSGLATGILKNTTGTGVPSIAVAADFPTLNQNTTGTAAGLSANIAEIQVTNLTTDLAAKAPLTSPTLTGVPAAPTATAGTNTTQIATTAFVTGAVSSGSAAAWALAGNSVTAGSQFLGSINTVSLRMRTNNIERMVVDSIGNVGIGVTGPSYKLQVSAASNPLQLTGLQTGANTDSILTVSNGVVKRLSPASLATSSSNAWALVGNTGSTTTKLGTTGNYDLPVITNNTTQMTVTAGGNIGIGSTAFDGAQPEKLMVDGGTTATNNIIGAYGDVNNYVQIGVQNRNSGNFASSDLVATADNGTNTTNYIDLGINSSGYANNASNILNRPNVGYLYTNATADFFIGNGATSQDMIFFTNNGSVGNTTANGNEAIRIDGDGNVGIGGTSRNNSGVKTTNAEKLVVQGNIIPRVSGSGTLGTSTYKWNAVYATNGTIQTSDRRMKTNILDLKYGLKEVLAMRPVSFNWKTTPGSNKKVGLIAQEVMAIVPEVVSGDETKETLGLNYAELVPVLINAVKEQQKEIEALKKMVEKLAQKK